MQFSRVALVAALAFVAHAGRLGGPISSSDRQAVGEALTEAIGHLNGDIKGGSKLGVCMQLFPSGKPTSADDAKSPTWQSCKDVLPHKTSLLTKLQLPLSGSERAAVGQALTTALGALENHNSGSKFESCMALFPKGEPRQGAMWESCKNEVMATLLQKKGPMTGVERAAVGQALQEALGALSNHQSGSKFDSCSALFAKGEPRQGPLWTSCKDVLLGSLIQEGLPLTGSEKQAVGQALTDALGAMSNHASGSKFESCASLFPPGEPRTGTLWQSCKTVMYSSFLLQKAAGPLTGSEKQQVGQALSEALGALSNHNSGSKFESCSSLFSQGEPRQGPLWTSCKDVLAGFLQRQPMTGIEKQQVGQALTNALGALSNHQSGSKFESCTALFPPGEPRQGPLWFSCKNELSGR